MNKTNNGSFADINQRNKSAAQLKIKQISLTKTANIRLGISALLLANGSILAFKFKR